MMMLPLLQKDLEQHRKGLLFYAASVLLVPFLFAALNHSASPAGFIGSVIGYLGFGGPMLMALWFVGQEKTKGTLRILRTLPISGTQIIGTKMVTSALVCLVLANLVLIAEPPLLGYVLHRPLHLGAAAILGLNGIICFVCFVYTAVFVVLEQKIAIQVSYWGIFGLVLAGFLGDKALQAHHFSLAAIPILPASIAGVVTLALLSFVALKVASRVFDWTDWSELEEG